MRRPRVAHIATVDLSIRFLLLEQLCRLRDEGFDVTAISAPGPWVPEIEAEGIRFLPWSNATRAWDPRSDARAFTELVRLLRRERFGLVHTHNPKPGVIGRLAAKAAGVPHIVNTVHGLYATPDDALSKRFAVLAAEGIASRCSDLELFQSEEDLGWARRRHVVRPQRSRLLGNGVDLSRFSPDVATADSTERVRRELGIPRDAVVIGTVGRIVREKGYLELFEAFAAVRRRRPDATLLVVGDSDPTKSDSIAADDLPGPEDGVVVAGWRTDVPALLAAMDVFVLASWREGMPRSAIEAAAMGKPLILTDIRGCREVVHDGVEGVLVPARDPARLRVALESMADDPTFRAHAGEAARRRALERFDGRRVADIVVVETRRLLGVQGGVEAREVGIRDARTTDVRRVAALHRASLPGSFLPSLGERFLCRLYRALVSDPAAVVLVSEGPTGNVDGFAAAVPSVGRFYRRFAVRHGVQALVAAAPSLMRPGTLARVRETASYPGEVGPALPEAELLAIAVGASAQGSGTGRALAEGVVDRLRSAGTSACKVVVAADNEGANHFYERLGFRLVSTQHVHADRISNVRVITCPSSSLSSSVSR